MKKILVPLLLIGLLLMGTFTVLAGPPEEISIPVIQVQTRYDSSGNLIQTLSPYLSTWNFRLTGNSLHGEMEYLPSVEDLRAYRFILTDRGGGVWVLRMGAIHYTSPYSGLTIQESWSGSLTLDQDFKLIEGTFTQICYTASPEGPIKYSQAEKGIPPKKGLWWLGHRLYTYSPQ